MGWLKDRIRRWRLRRLSRDISPQIPLDILMDQDKSAFVGKWGDTVCSECGSEGVVESNVLYYVDCEEVTGGLCSEDLQKVIREERLISRGNITCPHCGAVGSHWCGPKKEFR